MNFSLQKLTPLNFPIPCLHRSDGCPLHGLQLFHILALQDKYFSFSPLSSIIYIYPQLYVFFCSDYRWDEVWSDNPMLQAVRRLQNYAWVWHLELELQIYSTLLKVKLFLCYSICWYPMISSFLPFGYFLPPASTAETKILEETDIYFPIDFDLRFMRDLLKTNNCLILLKCYVTTKRFLSRDELFSG